MAPYADWEPGADEVLVGEGTSLRRALALVAKQQRVQQLQFRQQQAGISCGAICARSRNFLALISASGSRSRGCTGV